MTPPDSQTYTVESFLERLALKSQEKIWQKFSGNVLVQGTVNRVNVGSQRKHAFITLEGSGLTLDLRCPYNLRPAEGEYIVFSGQATLRPSKLNSSGLEVLIYGKPVGHWEPALEVTSGIMLKKESRTLLAHYLEQHPIQRLLIAGSDTGLSDFNASFNVASSTTLTLTTKQILVYEQEKLLHDLKIAIAEHNPSGIAIVRGGGDGTLNMWNDPILISEMLKFQIPIYLALGHSNRILLADKYADEIFHTPTSFGTALASQYRSIQILRDTKYKADKLGSELESLKNRSKCSISRLKRIIWGLLIFILLVAFFIYFTNETIGYITNFFGKFSFSHNF